jgi:hypothetical protein
MSTVNVERVGAAISPGKKLGTTIFTGRNGILCRYFYFAMSLLLAAIVVSGFKRTVNQNLFAERKVPAFLMELMVERHPKLGRLRTAQDFSEFGAGLAKCLAAAVAEPRP